MNTFIKVPSTYPHKKNSYKIYSRWYKTPVKIHKYQPSISPLCCRCNLSQGSLLHTWWECPLIHPFWKEVHRLITQITRYTDFTPAQYLLHHTSLPQSAYKKSLTLHLINAAKQSIPIFWRETNPPSISYWYHRIERIAEMEALIHQSKENPTKF